MWLLVLPLLFALAFFEGLLLAASQRFELVVFQEPIFFGSELFPERISLPSQFETGLCGHLYLCRGPERLS